MCGRFTITTPSELLSERFDAELPPDPLRPRYNAAPGQALPVILDSDPGRIVFGRWGYPMRVADRKKELINFRYESFAEKPFFQNVFLPHRCLVLADGFFEWERVAAGKLHKVTRSKDYEKFKEFCFETWKAQTLRTNLAPNRSSTSDS